MNERRFKQLINPHSHSDHSLDGAATVKQIVKRNAELGATHVALTEHGNMNSAMDLYTKALGAGLKPILGMEAYMVNPFHEEYVQLYRAAFKAGTWKPRNIKEGNTEAIERAIQRVAMNQYLHVTIHFKDRWAYQYFCGLSEAMYSRAVKKYDELKPMITLEELRGAAGHITIGSSCMKGPIQNFMLPSRDNMIQPSPEKSEWMYNQLREIAGPDGFFVEVFPHTVTHDWQKAERGDDGRIVKEGYFKPHECTCHAPEGDLQKPLNKYAIDLANKYGDKIIISLDSHFATEDQKVIQDAKLGNGEESWRFHNSYHIMPTDEAAAILKQSLGVDDKTIEKWVDNSYAFASNFNDFKLETSKERWVLSGDGDRFLNKLKSTIDKWGRMDWNNQSMIEQLKKEIQILAFNGKFNLLAYVETIEDIASFCRQNDILMNVRGSAGGSLLMYLIGVSGINPMPHNLSFGRFLTEGRIKANTLPDVDMDVSDQEQVIEYLKQKYGNKVCRLSTDLLLRIKSSIKDAERSIFGRVRPETEHLCSRSIPSTPQGKDDYEFVFGKEGQNDGLYNTNMQLRRYADENPQVWNVVSEMLGIQRNKSTHACGFIIADKPITDYMPIIKVNDEWVTGFSPKSAEAAGLVKFDLLGLNTLRDIRLCVKSIKERTGEVIDPFHLPFDKTSAENFQLGKTEGVFQFDTPTVRPLQTQIFKADQMKTVVDICEANAGITSLGRPGTLDAPSGDGRTLAQVYIARANGEPTQYVHPDLEPILKNTFGVQLYQEQTIQIFKDIGGMDDAEADEVRRGIGKKIEKVLNAATAKLREGALKRGWTEDQVKILMDQVMASANYSFNKSHAVSYAYVAYACMYLKTKYPLDWWKAILSNSSKDELATKFWKHVKNFTILPDINKSKETYEIVGDKIIAPFSILTGVGPKAYEDLIKHTPYSSLEHFVSSHFPTKAEEDEKKRQAKLKKQAKTTGVNAVIEERLAQAKKSAVNAGIARKLIAAGVLDSLFEEGSIIEDKLEKFEQMRGQVRGKRPETVPEEFSSISQLGKFLLRKQLVQIYSEDLRPVMLANRGARVLPLRINGAEGWFTQDGYPVLDGMHLEYFKSKLDAKVHISNVIRHFDMLLPEGAENFFQPSVTGETERRFYVLAYVISEKSFPYKNKTKYANRMVLDVNGFFTEEMLWPGKDMDEAEMGFKNLPVLASFYMSSRGVQLGSVTPLLAETDLEKYNMV